MMTTPFKNALTTLTKDPQWRVKMATFELIGDIGFQRILDKDQFQNQVQEIFFTYLNNTAAEVRNTGVRKLEKLAEVFDAEWCLTKVVPRVITLIQGE